MIVFLAINVQYICMGEEENLILQNKFQDWFGEIVPPDLPLSAEAGHLNHRRQKRRVSKSTKMYWLLLQGFGGAISFGSVVGFIIYILNLSIWKWNSYNWLIQFLIIFSAMAIGFYISLVKVFGSQKQGR